MDKLIHKIATFTTLVLISSIPLPMDAFADAEKNLALLTLPVVTKVGQQQNTKSRQNINKVVI
jgi:hypothetical protein